MNTITNFEQAREQVKGCLEQYLAGFGINTSKRFPCPIHNGKDSNAGIIPGTDLIHCFTCGTTADIFDVAASKEGKPLSGRGFVTDNLIYLAKRFGVELPEIDLSDAELLELQTYRAYAQATRIIQYSTMNGEASDQIKEKLANYMWPRDPIFKTGIGSVKSYASYIEKMTKEFGHSLEFLEQIDLAGKDGKQHAIFQPHCLIYPIRDEDGRPIAFSARNLNFESEKASYDAKVLEIESSNKTDDKKKAEKDKLWKPRKGINTRTTKIFEKGKSLFNFNEACKSANKQLVVVEGNADCMTLSCGGLKSAVACCGTAFTVDHLQMAIRHGISKIVLIFDADAAGENATKRFIETLEQYGDHPGLEVSIVAMPEGTDDPDAYVRAFGDLRAGVREFRKLPQVDLFSWKIKASVEAGGNPSHKPEAATAVSRIPPRAIHIALVCLQSLHCVSGKRSKAGGSTPQS